MMIEGVLVTPLKVVEVSGGDVLHAMKCEDPGFQGFGEAYFSIVERGAVKAWKRHHDMTMNLVVPVGSIRFVMYDERPDSATFGNHQVVELSRNNYARLTIPCMVWFGMQGQSDEINILLNIANIMHDYRECERKDVDEIKYSWGE